ncbi:MAG: formate--tetrahydrofolate ligase [Thermovirgaceae bacterium]|nr:formate--tetrahydrofolate ligase [Thermovirgaceae bacterium]
MDGSRSNGFHYLYQENDSPKEKIETIGKNIYGAGAVQYTDTAEKGLAGDADFTGVGAKASWITPVPGGVGLMTIAMLLMNTFERYLEA